LAEDAPLKSHPRERYCFAASGKQKNGNFSKLTDARIVSECSAGLLRQYEDAGIVVVRPMGETHGWPVCFAAVAMRVSTGM